MARYIVPYYDIKYKSVNMTLMCVLITISTRLYRDMILQHILLNKNITRLKLFIFSFMFLKKNFKQIITNIHSLHNILKIISFVCNLVSSHFGTKKKQQHTHLTLST